MEDLGVKDSAAHRVIRQMVDHTWGSEEEMSSRDVVLVCQNFHARGGSWEALMDGDMRSVSLLGDSIDALVNSRNMVKMAARLASRPFRR